MNRDGRVLHVFYDGLNAWFYLRKAYLDKTERDLPRNILAFT